MQANAYSQVSAMLRLGSTVSDMHEMKHYLLGIIVGLQDLLWYSLQFWYLDIKFPFGYLFTDTLQACAKEIFNLFLINLFI